MGGANIAITATTWTSGSSVYNIELYTDAIIVMQNPADATYNPSKWTKVEWHASGSGFGYCQSVYDGETAAAALAADTSSIYDATDASAGCNGFSHSVASPS